MSAIKISNLTAKEAFSKLNSFQENYASSYAVQGKKDCRYIHANLILATVRSNRDDIDERFEKIKYSFQLSSNYYSQDNLENFFENEFTSSL